MTLDTVSLRVAFGAVALSLLVMSFADMRGRRPSAYRAWWCAATALFVLGAGAYLLDGTSQQVWANPLGNVLSVLGAGCVWAGARSLRPSAPPLTWQLLVGPAVAGAAAVLDHPESNIWAGGAVFLGLMGSTVALSSVELWRLEDGDAAFRVPLALASGVVGVFYLARCAAFVAGGPSGRVFTSYFGSGETTVVSMVLLVIVSFSMSTFSAEQASRDLRDRAAHDGLTGLLTRAAFLERATGELGRLGTGGTRGVLILADLDHFKAVNDTYGHAAGDVALRAFAAACRGTVRSTDLVGRYGGEEFVLFLPGADLDLAQVLTRQISRALERTPVPEGFPLPTASYGIAPAGGPGRGDVEAAIASADEALYRAKSQGRNRTATAG